MPQLRSEEKQDPCVQTWTVDGEGMVRLYRAITREDCPRSAKGLEEKSTSSMW